jgi:hypothetical protein
VSSPSTIRCPACQSEIGADGKSLVTRSPHLEELEKAADVLETVTGRCEQLEADLEKEKKAHALESVVKKERAKSWLDTD